MSSIESLIVLAVFVLFAIWGKHFWWQWQRERLRDNPPERAYFEVSLPVGVENSTEVMRRVFAQISGLCNAGPAQRRNGEGQISFEFVGSRPEHADPDEIPEVRTYVECDKRIAKSIKKTLKSSFPGGMVQVIDVPEHPLRKIANQVRPPKPESK